jgi:hypothetical protein
LETKRELAMGAATGKIPKETILLPADERVSLVENLLQSLNLPTEDEVIYIRDSLSPQVS